MWSCLYITDRGAEEYESYGSIVDPQSGICDLCDRWIFSSASEFEPQRVDRVWVDVYSDRIGTTSTENLIDKCHKNVIE